MSPARTAPPPEPDRIRPLVFLIGLLALTLFGLATLVTEWVHRIWLAHLGPRRPIPAQLGQPAINELEQPPFPLDIREELHRADQERRLHEYGWVDRAHGIIHVPVEQAEQDLVGGEGRGGAGR